MNYKSYKLQNLKCMILDIPKISKIFKKHVELTIEHPLEDELGTTYIELALKADAKKEMVQVLEFEVVRI